MAEIKYTANRDIPENIAGVEKYSIEDTQLISSFEVNSSFDTSRHFVELHLLSLSDDILFSEYDYRGFRQLGNAQSAGQEGASVLTIDPIQDSISYDYNNGGVKLLYHFLNDLFTDNSSSTELYIQDISPDRTELKLTSLTISPEDLTRFATNIKTKLESEAFFNEFRLNFGDNDLLIGINIDTLDSGLEKVVVVRLYEPLPATYGIKSKVRVVELVADSVAYEVDSEVKQEEVPLPTLKPANFNLEVQDNNIIPTQYLNYDELFSYPINNANSELFSLFNEKGVEVSIDHTLYSDFVHFSSAQERLMNFKYKLDLVNSYSASLAAISTQTVGLQGISGSSTYYKNLMEGVISNFDHYERFLYYESGSSSWPKYNNTKPYRNQVSTTNESVLWYSNQIAEAISYDNTNYSSLVYSIPTYLREDENNENYLTFIHMIGQHFDNLWLYADAVTDKYDADNRLNKGISKDLVGEALKNFGVKLYTSNKSIEDLFSSFVGQGYVSGSEVINNYITGSLIGSNTPIEPSSFDNYQKEIQKRIYHNLSYLLKTKGTERGLRALINCFGIPSNILEIKVYGGRNTDERPFYGDYQYYTSSLNKVRTDHTGSIVSGSTLSSHTSIIKRDNKYTDDLHVVEVGFSPTDNVDKYIISKQTCNVHSISNTSLSTALFSYINCTTFSTIVSTINAGATTLITAISGSLIFNTPSQVTVTVQGPSPTSFNIDNYIGDPNNLTLPNYQGLYQVAEDILGNLDQYDVRAYVRLIKFFDNVIFKMIKDFVPARAVADTGIIIKPNLLNRSKAKSITPSVTPIASASMDNAFNYTSSIDTAFILGSNGGAFKSGSSEVSTNHRLYVKGLTSTFLDRSVKDESPKFNGQLTGSQITLSTGELNVANLFKQTDNSKTYYHVQLYEGIPNTVCLLTGTSQTIGIVNGGVTVNFSTIFPLANAGTEYTVNGVAVQGGSFTFPNLPQYDPYTIVATTPNLYTNPPTNTIPCTATKIVKVVNCTITPAIGAVSAPASVDATTAYNITSWFNTGTNTQVDYFVNGQIIATPNAHVFTGVGLNQTLIVTAADRVRTSCVAEVRVSTNPCQLKKQSGKIGQPVPNHPGDITGYNIVQDYFVGDDANTTYEFRLLYTNQDGVEVLLTKRADNSNPQGYIPVAASHLVGPNYFPMEDVNNSFFYITSWPSLDALASACGLGVVATFPNYNLYRSEVESYPWALKVQFRANANIPAVPNCLAESSVRAYNTSYGNYNVYPVTLSHTLQSGPTAYHYLCYQGVQNVFYISEPLPTTNGDQYSSFLDGFAANGVVLFSDINRTVPTTARWVSDGVKIYKYHGGGEWSTLAGVYNSCISYYDLPNNGGTYSSNTGTAADNTQNLP